ncbi:M1 family metallopeptidase [Flaviaesturariibacter amylovorans]|uniref:M1 family metallopeptidase n=1 Tax=Flaviaesturariibacter amylovorans TaxID=1084520 RepID=A0ABP8GIW8_9BACT
MKQAPCLLLAAALLATATASAQPLQRKRNFTHQDTLRGTVNEHRAWWDVQRYDVSVTPDFTTRTVKGHVDLYFRTKTAPGSNFLQIDLQQPMQIDTAVLHPAMGANLPKPGGSKKADYRLVAVTGGDLLPDQTFRREGNAYFIAPGKLEANKTYRLRLSYSGVPRPAVNPPWDGGWIWKKDRQGNAWMSVACQGLGASVWYPCKDHQSDEPDLGASLSMTVPDTMRAIANGRPTGERSNADYKLRTYSWEVNSPINSYNIVPYIGKYVTFSDTLMGEGGKLDLNYWVLEANLEKAKKQFEQVKPMMRAFEYWFGAYPFYEDGFKLVESPHLGMEHQSAVAYGNQYKNGYLGMDRSGSGHGKDWDYIIVHESGHEWFANNITTKDIADMWVHEGFTTYSEALFIEYFKGKEAADAYVQGLRRNISNDRPIIGYYGVNQEGSGDMYDKGANMIHTIRTVINDDKLFREILRGMNKDFHHGTVTTQQVEQYISKKSGKDLSKIFDQYLRTTQIPELELKADGDKVKFRWVNCIDGFNMPVRLSNGQWIKPTTAEGKLKLEGANFDGVTVDKNFYIQVAKGS